MGKDIKVMILLVAISFGLNYLYISNRDSNAEIVFSDNIEAVDYLVDDSTTENLVDNLEEILSQEITETDIPNTTINTNIPTTTQETITQESTTQETTIIIQDNNNKININTATLEELTNIPSIGEVLAQRIIDYRTNICLFDNIVDIINVSGIGEKTFENLKDFISID